MVHDRACERDRRPGAGPARRSPGFGPRWDRAAGAGVPAHVTVLFPFLPARGLVPAVRRELAAIAATQAPFEVIFATVGRFPDVVYLAPRPAEPFTRLTGAVAARFPDFPPYGGAFDEVIPHLTIAESDEAPLDDDRRGRGEPAPVRMPSRRRSRSSWKAARAAGAAAGGSRSAPEVRWAREPRP